MNYLKKKKLNSSYGYQEIDSNQGKMSSIPGFSFPFLTKFTKETYDGQHIISVGSYPSQIKCFSLTDLNLKFQRNFDSDITDFQILSSNWEKMVFLRSDKKLDFHSKSGFFYQIKLSEKGTDLTMDNKKLLLYIPGIGNQVSILDFKEGRFLNELKLNDDTLITCSGINKSTGLVTFGTKSGETQFWDPRITTKCIGRINGSKFTKIKSDNQVSSLRFSDKSDNLFFTGFNSGEVLVFDLRCFSPFLSKLVQPFHPIISIRASYDSDYILTSTSSSLKFWRLSTGKTTFYSKSDIKINHICSIRNTGIVFFSLNSKNIGIKYFKHLGPLPSWSKTSF